MPIGLTNKQKGELAAMLPHIDESIASLKRLITDAKDRTRALAKLTEAEEAQKRHARDVGVPFNAEAFAARRAELNALPKELTVEDGQLSAFQQLQRAIAVVVDGPYVREGRSTRGPARKPTKTAAGRKSGGKTATKTATKTAAKSPRPLKNARPSKQRASGKGGAPRLTVMPSTPSAPMKRVKPLPLALGS